MKEEIEKLTQNLVQVDSTVGNSVNAAMVLKDFLEKHGYEAELTEYKDGEANVFVEIGPKNTAAMLISGHVDTVPFGNPEEWTHDPLSGTIIDNYLWGRGSVDMKGGTASLAGVMVELLDHEDDLQQRVVFAATAEEETGLHGAQEFVKQGKIENISHVIIAEPTDLEPKVREKGIMWFKIKATGKQAHASRPDLGYNAIEGLASLFPQLHEALPDLSTPDLGKTSLNPGIISGGTAANVVPEHAEVTCDIRTTPGVVNDDVLATISDTLEKNSNGVKYSLEVMENVDAVQSPDNTFAQLLADKTADFTGSKPELGGVHYATDGAVFMNHLENKVPFVIYGPGSTELLHQTDERLDLTQLDISRKVMTQTILDTITA